MLDEDQYWRATESRDPRFDGRFFVATVTVGVYCRVTCPAPMPLRRNVQFFPSAAAAEAAGFRPCRRCRPGSAPGAPDWDGGSAIVSRALQAIENGAVDEHGVTALARGLGVGERYLRRLFAKHLGTSPHAVAISRRVHFADLLLAETALPVTEIAFASGFRSIRQFNAMFRAVFGKAPSEVRRRSTPESTPGEFALRLAYRPPFDWDAMLAFLAARAIPGVEAVRQGRYLRTFAGSRRAGMLEIGLSAGRHSLDLRVRGAEPGDLLAIVRKVRRVFDLAADPLAIATRLGSTALLAQAVAARPGLRIPGVWDGFEAIVRGILGQQISIRAATTLCGRLVRRFGAEVAAGEGLTHLFPAPAALAGADLGDLGLTRSRERSLAAAAVAIAREPGLLEPASSLDALVERLCALPGVGVWTAHYVAMRGFGEPDAFPSGDLGLLRASGSLSVSALEELAEQWRPWRAYATMHLWQLCSEEGKHAAARLDPALAV